MGNAFLAEIGKRIGDRRRELRFTQEYVAEKMGVSMQTVSCIELGKKAIRPENLAKLCTVLDIDSDYILFGKRNEKQLSGISKICSLLSDDDLSLVTELARRLSSK